MNLTVKTDDVVTDLRSQHRLLEALIQQLESKTKLDESACRLYDQITKQVERNLRRRLHEEK